MTAARGLKTPSRQHRLPAAVIGRFGHDSNERARLRRVHVRNRAGKLYSGRADSLTIQNKVYDFQDARVAEMMGRSSLEPAWHLYEVGIGRLLDWLDCEVESESVQMTADEGLRTLIPYLAGTLVRGQNYWSSSQIDRSVGFDALNMSRAEAWQNGSAFLMKCNLTLIRAAPGSSYILNDLGYVIRDDYLNEDEESIELDVTRPALVFPLTPNVVLLASRDRESSYRCAGTASQAEVENTFFHLQQMTLNADGVAIINAELAAFCWREIYGSRRSLLEGVDLANVRPNPRYFVPDVLYRNVDPRVEITLWQKEVYRLGIRAAVMVPDLWF